MLYNEKTDKYVIWFHNDNSTEKNEYKYDVGMSGVAISDSPFGPFKFIERYRLHECPEGQIDCYPTSKGEARDMNLFKDDDGTAYIIYSSENNKTLYISKLNEEYTYLSAKPEEAVYLEDYIRLFPGAMREAPALCKGDNGRYYLTFSKGRNEHTNCYESKSQQIQSKHCAISCAVIHISVCAEHEGVEQHYDHRDREYSNYGKEFTEYDIGGLYWQRKQQIICFVGFIL